MFIVLNGIFDIAKLWFNLLAWCNSAICCALNVVMGSEGKAVFPVCLHISNWPCHSLLRWQMCFLAHLRCYGDHVLYCTRDHTRRADTNQCLHRHFSANSAINRRFKTLYLARWLNHRDAVWKLAVNGNSRSVEGLVAALRIIASVRPRFPVCADPCHRPQQRLTAFFPRLQPNAVETVATLVGHLNAVKFFGDASNTPLVQIFKRRAILWADHCERTPYQSWSNAPYRRVADDHGYWRYQLGWARFNAVGRNMIGEVIIVRFAALIPSSLRFGFDGHKNPVLREFVPDFWLFMVLVLIWNTLNTCSGFFIGECLMQITRL